MVSCITLSHLLYCFSYNTEIFCYKLLPEKWQKYRKKVATLIFIFLIYEYLSLWLLTFTYDVTSLIIPYRKIIRQHIQLSYILILENKKNYCQQRHILRYSSLNSETGNEENCYGSKGLFTFLKLFHFIAHSSAVRQKFIIFLHFA